MDSKKIEEWMDEKYKFWKNSHPLLQDRSEVFWKFHRAAEMPKRQQYLEILFKYVKNPYSTNIVDVGVGWGMFPFLLNKLGLNVTGLEWRGVGTLKELKKQHPGIKIHSCYYDKERWPIEDGSTDIVTLLDLIEHIHPPWQYMFGEIMRIMKPGGILIITTPNYASLRKRLWLLAGRNPVGQLELFFRSNPFIEHIRELTLDEVCQIVQWAGFDILSAKCINHLYHYRYAQESNRLKKYILRIYKHMTILRNDLKDTIVVTARKPD